MKNDKKICVVLLIVYITALLYFLFFSEFLGRTSVAEDLRYNLVPFREIRRFIKYASQIGLYGVAVNLVGNVVVFIPLGYFVGIFQKEPKRIWKGIMWTFTFSLEVELIQLITRVGICDVDDLILNTIGGAVGIIIYGIIHRYVTQNNM